MRRALQIASLADGSTSPNPLVGAVVLDKNGDLVGEGFHSYAGGPHAEVVALSQASEKAKGGTLVVTLEPCCHFGLTPPCTELILRYGISRVVVALEDPDQRVSGKGIAYLKQAGLEVVEGVLKEEAAFLNREFIFRIKTGRPWGILKWAMSLDGRIGLPNGQSQWISGEKARKSVHYLRAKSDAIIVGGGTIRADNPLLTSRGISDPEPLRVVFTSSLNFPERAQIFDTSVARTLIAYSSLSSKELLNGFPDGPDFLELSSSNPINLLEALGQKGCNRVLWECGPKLATEAIKHNCVQELLVVASPKLLGGVSAMTPLENFGFESISQAFVMDNISLRKLGNDFIFNMPLSKKMF
tara:strand:- start:1281 stop:2348 length:1068 start_codon:yes stop_codon:yes gene_type:complete